MIPFMAGYASTVSTAFSTAIMGSDVASLNAVSTSIATANIPSETLTGDLLLMIGTARNSQNVVGVNTPSGWTALYNTSFVSGIRRCFAFYKTASSDGAGTQAMTLTGNPGSSGASSAIIVLAIRGNVAAPEVGTGTAATSTSPNPASFSPSAGSNTYLLLPTVHADWGAGGSYSLTPPSGYTLAEEAYYTTGSAYLSVVGVGELEDTGSSFDPGAWTLGASKQNYTALITVR